MKKHRKLLILAETVYSAPEECGDRLWHFIQYAIGV